MQKVAKRAHFEVLQFSTRNPKLATDVKLNTDSKNDGVRPMSS